MTRAEVQQGRHRHRQHPQHQRACGQHHPLQARPGDGVGQQHGRQQAQHRRHALGQLAQRHQGRRGLQRGLQVLCPGHAVDQVQRQLAQAGAHLAQPPGHRCGKQQAHRPQRQQGQRAGALPAEPALAQPLPAPQPAEHVQQGGQQRTGRRRPACSSASPSARGGARAAGAGSPRWHTTARRRAARPARRPLAAPRPLRTAAMNTSSPSGR
jgi:hypothetical protein